MYKKIILVLLVSIIITGTAFIYGINEYSKNININKIKSENKNNITEKYEEHIQEPEPVINNVKLTFTGDLMVHEWQINNAYNKNDKTYNFDYCFEPVYKYLKNSDLTIGNLETTINGNEKGFLTYPRFNSPVEFVDSLKNAGFDILTTANNHSMDTFEQGVLNTIKVLDERGIEHFGTYESIEKRDTILIKEVNNIKFAFISYTYGTNGIPIPEGKEYLVNILNQELIDYDIRKAKQLNPDFIIVMPHMGIEYETYPNDSVVQQIDNMIKSGADIVISSHPHVLQKMEYRNVVCDTGEKKTAFVAYSMGNFISSQRTEPREAGVIVNLYFEKKGNEKAEIIKSTYIPTWVQWRDKNNNYLIRVLSVYDILSKLNNKEDTGLRNKDIERIKNVNKQSNKVINNIDITIDNIKEEYEINKSFY